MMERLAIFVATGCYVGRIPGAPGTYASALTALVFYAVFRLEHRIVPELHLSATCLIAAIGTLAAAPASRSYRSEDPAQVVIDEVAGQLAAWLFLPVTLTWVVAGFLLFRLFDIWKPFPIRRIERIPHGVGIMADDLAAGIYANLVLRIFRGLWS